MRKITAEDKVDLLKRLHLFRQEQTSFVDNGAANRRQRTGPVPGGHGSEFPGSLPAQTCGKCAPCRAGLTRLHHPGQRGPLRRCRGDSAVRTIPFRLLVWEKRRPKSISAPRFFLIPEVSGYPPRRLHPLPPPGWGSERPPANLHSGRGCEDVRRSLPARWKTTCRRE